jgi:hypothetical protein
MTTGMPTATPTRALPARTLPKTDIGTLMAALQDQRAHAIDLVVPVGDLEFEGGNFVISGREAKLTDNGFYEVNGLYRPVPSVDNQLDSVLDIPVKYVRKLRGENPGLLDTNLNSLAGMLADKNPDQKQLLRLLWGESPDFPGSTGVVRALLSNGYRIQDNLDTVLAVLKGLGEAGLNWEAIKQVDLSNDRLYMWVESKEIAIKATQLLDGYRDPRTGTTSREVGDIVSAGMVIQNGEIGNGQFSVTPVITALACKNGMTQKVDVMARRHVGSRMDAGEIEYSDDTRIKINAAMAAQVRDVTKKFLSTDYVDTAIRRMEADAGVEISNPAKTVELVAKELSFTQAEQEQILAAFYKGGRETSDGVMHAVTYVAQDADIDRGYELMAAGVDAMKVAKRLELSGATSA